MAADTGTVLFEDTFDDDSGLGEHWQLMRAGDFRADDGIAVASPAGLSVAPGARHPRTGEPSFTKIESGAQGHLKWLAVTSARFATGDGALRFSFRAGARTFGMSEHPFGDEVEDPRTDLRLGAATVHVMDFESGVIFDFWITETAIYPFYERLRFLGAPPDYEAFGSIASAVPRTPGTESELSIVVDVAAGLAQWDVDGRGVARVREIGPSAPDWTTVLHHGGPPERVAPRQLQVGLGLLTLLDASLGRPDHGLVDLGMEYVPARSFHGGPHLWGQGVELTVRRVAVERA